MKNYISKNYKDMLQLAKNISKNRSDYMDLAHEMMEYLMLLSSEKQTMLIEKKQVRPYYIRMLQNNIIGHGSPYYRKYMHEVSTIPIEDRYYYVPTEYDEYYDQMEAVIESDLHWDYKMLFNMRIHNGMSMKEISTKTGISITSLYPMYAAAKESAKEKYRILYLI